MEECTFCQIIEGKVPSHIIDKDDYLCVFLSLENHPLIVPKKHIQNIYNLDEITGSAIMKSLSKTARVMKKALNCDGVYIAQANEPAAGQDVFHMHFHVIPCWNGQPMNLRQRIDDTERQATAEKLRQFSH